MKGPGALAVIATVGVTLHGTAALILQLFASERADDISLLPQVRLFPTLCCIGCGSPLSSLRGYFNPALSRRLFIFAELVFLNFRKLK